MTTERIDIQIREDGSRVVTVNINNIGAAADKSANKVNLFNSVLKALAGSLVVQQLIKLSDEYTRMQNRLALTTTSQANLNAVMGELNAISSRTRSSISTNVELYSRLSLSAKELGVSQSEVLQFTESLNQAVKLSGASATEAEAGIIQLTQGLASGTLRGDELRSVLEQLPAVADTIAKSMGVTRGELRQLGTEGKINADIIFKAFREAKDELNNNFAKTVPTIGEGFTLLKNQALLSVGALNEASNATGELGSGLKVGAELLKDLTVQLVAVIRGITGTLDPMDELSSGAQVAATIFTVLYGTLKALGQLLLGTVILAFQTAGRVIGGVVAAVVAVINGDFKGAMEIIKTAATDVKDNWVDSSVEMANSAINTTTTMFERLDQIWNKGARSIQDRQKLAVGTVNTQSGPNLTKTGPSEAELEKQAKAMQKLENQLSSLLNTIAPIPGAMLEMQQATALLNKAEQSGLISKKQQNDYLQLLTAHYQDILEPIAALNREMAEQNILLDMNAQARSIEAQVIAIQKDQITKGIVLTKSETDALRAQLLAMDEKSQRVQIEDQLLANSIQKRKTFMTQMAEIQALLNAPEKGFTEDDAIFAYADMFPGMLENTRAYADANINIYRDMYAQIAASSLDAATKEKALSNVRVKIAELEHDNKFGNLQQSLTAISSLTSSHNKTLFRIGKAAAIASATVEAGAAVTKAYNTSPWYLGLALGVEAAARLASVVGDIKNTQMQGYMTGGYTGDGGVADIAGVVHKREWVADSATTSRIGVANLEALRNGTARVSRTEEASTSNNGSIVMPKITIENLGPAMSVETKSVSRDEIRLIAKQEAQKEVSTSAPEIIAGQISQPNSSVSKSLASSLEVSRRR